MATRKRLGIKAPPDHYALSALGNLVELVPGPMAQAITFSRLWRCEPTLETTSLRWVGPAAQVVAGYFFRKLTVPLNEEAVINASPVP